MKKFFEKIFGGIDLSWPKVVISAVVIGVLVGFLMAVSGLKDTAFQDIGVIFYWWVLFGVIIIMNSKSNLDSALKCFVFFLISQPLIYLVQVPFSYMGWGLFGYYKYWFIWTILTIPMGYIGYFMKKNEIAAAVILAPALVLVGFEGAINFPLVSEKPDLLFRLFMTILISLALIFGVLKGKMRIVGVLVPIMVFSIGFFGHKNEAEVNATSYISLGEYGINVSNGWEVKESEDERRKRIFEMQERLKRK